MATKTKKVLRIEHGEAFVIVRDFVDGIRDCCERIEIAGALRRDLAFVSQAEIVAVPKPAPALFDVGERIDAGSPLSRRLEDLYRTSVTVRRRTNGPRRKQYLLPCESLPNGLPVGLTLCEPEQWGVCLAKWTGPADYFRQLVTPRSRAGLLRNGCYVHELRVHEDKGKKLDTFEERDFFDLVQGGWRDPAERENFARTSRELVR